MTIMNCTYPKTTILEVAAELTSNDRNKTYGHPKDNFEMIARLWDAYIDHRRIAWKRENPSEGFQIEAHDVAQMFILTKVARLANTPGHRDSLVDIAGYARTAEMLDE